MQCFMLQLNTVYLQVSEFPSPKITALDVMHLQLSEFFSVGLKTLLYDFE